MRCAKRTRSPSSSPERRMTRTQRNVLAELILAALRDEDAAAALRALADVVAAPGPVTIASRAVAWLARAGLVAVTSTDAAGDAVRLSPACLSARRDIAERVQRALAAVADVCPGARAAPPPCASQPL